MRRRAEPQNIAIAITIALLVALSIWSMGYGGQRAEQAVQSRRPSPLSAFYDSGLDELLVQFADEDDDQPTATVREPTADPTPAADADDEADADDAFSDPALLW